MCSLFHLRPHSSMSSLKRRLPLFSSLYWSISTRTPCFRDEMMVNWGKILQCKGKAWCYLASSYWVSVRSIQRTPSIKESKFISRLTYVHLKVNTFTTLQVHVVNISTRKIKEDMWRKLLEHLYVHTWYYFYITIKEWVKIIFWYTLRVSIS